MHTSRTSMRENLCEHLEIVRVHVMRKRVWEREREREEAPYGRGGNHPPTDSHKNTTYVECTMSPPPHPVYIYTPRGGEVEKCHVSAPECTEPKKGRRPATEWPAKCMCV